MPALSRSDSASVRAFDDTGTAQQQWRVGACANSVNSTTPKAGDWMVRQ